MSADRLRRLAANATEGPWRVGSTVGRTIYKGHGPDDLIGVMNTREDAQLVALAPSLALLLADMTEALASYDHSDDDCQGECVPGTRKQIYERDFAPLVDRLAALVPEETA